MANIINQLEISGITYDIQDADAQNTLLTKQDTLVSGVNIKTINNESLLGSGNIDIQGGTGDAYTKAETDALLANKADTSAMTEDIEAAVSGKADTSAVTAAIDAAVSGKANSSDVYLKSETSSSTEINNALEAKADASTTYSKSEVDTAINAATSGKADTSAVTAETQRAMAAEQALSGAISSNTGAYGFDFYGVRAEDVQVDDALWDDMVAAFEAGKPFITTTDTMAKIYPLYVEYDEVENHFFLQIIWDSGYEGLNINRVEEGGEYSYEVESVEEWEEVDTELSTTSPNPVANSAVTLAMEDMNDGLGADILAATSGKADTSAVTADINAAVSGKQDTLVSGTNIKTINNQSLLGSGNITIQGGGGANVVELTQAQYDALATKDPDTFYIITDATPIDTNSFYTTAQTSSSTQIATALQAKADAATTSSATEIATALSDKQNTLTAGSGIDISNDVISVTGGGGGGGKAVSAGTNISITTGDTADTINCTLPITQKGNYQSIQIGTGNSSVYGDRCLVMGNSVNANFADTVGFGTTIALGAKTSYAMGINLSTSNEGQFSSGYYNTSVKESNTRGSSGNTLFCVGNGYYHYPIEGYHNALEIRQNGDIYYADTNNTTYQNYYEKPMIKLQDKFDEIDTTIGDINTILSSL